MSPPEPSARRVAELLAFAHQRLPSMRAADGAFCHHVVSSSPTPHGRSLRYTLIVLLGALRAEAAGRPTTLSTPELKALVLAELGSAELQPGDLGLALWMDARSGLEAVSRILSELERRLDASAGLGALEGLELSWILTGCATASGAGVDDPRLERLLLAARERQIARAETPSGLLLHHEAGWRARFPNFATQIYGVLALVEAARARDDERCLVAACKVADELVALQRPDGGWPWLYDARRGSVVEPYEIYSVHQDSMAPMALMALSDATGERRYGDAAVRGLEWLWENELGIQMLDGTEGIIHRSIRRRRPLDRLALYASTATALAGRPVLAAVRGPLQVNRTDRPYHLGWVLEAWSGRNLSAF